MAGNITPISVPVRMTTDELQRDLANIRQAIGQTTADIEKQFTHLNSKLGRQEINMGSWTPNVLKMFNSAARGNFNQGYMDLAQSYRAFFEGPGAGLDGAAKAAQQLNVLMQRMLGNKAPVQANQYQIASPLWNNLGSAGTQNLATDNAYQSQMRRLQNIEATIETGGRVNRQMANDLQELEGWFNRTTQAASQFQQVLSRIALAKDTIRQVLPPESGLDRVAAGMTAAGRARLDTVAAGMSMAGMHVPEYGQRPLDPVAAGMNAAAQQRLSPMIAGMSLAGLRLQDPQARGPIGMATRGLNVLGNDNWFEEIENYRSRESAASNILNRIANLSEADKVAALSQFARSTRAGTAAGQDAALRSFASALSRSQADSATAEALFGRIGGLAESDKVDALGNFRSAVNRGRADTAVAENLLARISNLSEADKVSALNQFARSTRAGTAAGQDLAMQNFASAISRSQQETLNANSFIERIQQDNKRYQAASAQYGIGGPGLNRMILNQDDFYSDKQRYADRQQHFRDVREREHADNAYKQQVVKANQDRAAQIQEVQARDAANNARFGIGGPGLNRMILNQDDFYSDKQRYEASARFGIGGPGLNNMILNPDFPPEAAGPGKRTLTAAERKMVQPKFTTDEQRWRYEALQSIDANKRGDLRALKTAVKGFESLAELDIDAATTSKSKFQAEFLKNRINTIQANPVLNRVGNQSGFRGNSLTAMNIGYGIEDFVIASQYGGLPMGIRAAVNNVTPIVGSMMMNGQMSGRAGAWMMAGAAFSATAVALGAEKWSQAIKTADTIRAEDITDKYSERRFSRTMTAPIETGWDNDTRKERIESINRREVEIKDQIKEIKEEQASRAANVGRFGEADHFTKSRAENRQISQLLNEQLALGRERGLLRTRINTPGSTGKEWEDAYEKSVNAQLRWDPLNDPRTFDGQMGAVRDQYNRELRANEDAFASSDQGKEAKKAYEENKRRIEQSYDRQRSELIYQGKLGINDFERMLDRGLSNKSTAAQLGEDLIRQIEQNQLLDEDPLKQASFYRKARELVLKTGKNELMGDMLPEQQAYEKGSLSEAQYIRRLSAPEGTLSEDILQVLRDIDKKLAGVK